MREISKCRFEALAGYIRNPNMVFLLDEVGWFADAGEQVVAVVVRDRWDNSFGWIALGRDTRLRFRAVDQGGDLPGAAAARVALAAAFERLASAPDGEYFQGDEEGAPVDFFASVGREDRLATGFRALSAQPRFSPAREIVGAMMRYHEDVDGNFIEQFQTAGFDARLWELYLFATFTELGYARRAEANVPDFVLEGPLGSLAIEATTANPPQGRAVPVPKTIEEARAYLEGYVPIKLARALTRKLHHRRPYWEEPGVAGAPFVIALQDFHAPGAMTRIVGAATDYAFGTRHSMVDGERQIKRIDRHRFEGMSEPSGFFRLPGSENVSAIILNPQGTLTKFNRIGQLAGFGDPRVRMVRAGIARGELNKADPRPFPFEHDVSDPGYREGWVEGTVVLHNPDALVPLDPEQIPGAAHEFLQPDGSIMSLLPDFQPYTSVTSITIEGETEHFADQGDLDAAPEDG